MNYNIYINIVYIETSIVFNQFFVAFTTVQIRHYTGQKEKSDKTQLSLCLPRYLADFSVSDSTLYGYL